MAACCGPSEVSGLAYMRAVNAQVKKGGVKVVNAPEVPVQVDLPANQVLACRLQLSGN